MDLEQTIQQFQRAAVEFAKGNPAPVKAIFSHRDDVVLANPFGPAVKGWNNVSAALDLASSRFRDGDVIAFETIASYRTDELACFHEVERWRAKVAGGSEIAPML